jgi:PKD repeat protein
MRVYKERSASETVTIGAPASAVRYQNADPISPNCAIYSIITDNAGNFSAVNQRLVNIDWTAPTSFAVNDGLSSDVDIFVNATEISANWPNALDPHSDVVAYSVAVGTTAGGAQDVVAFTSVGNQTSATLTGLTLTVGQTYYVSVKATNGAGLTTTVFVSDGQTLQVPTSPPIANFYAESSVVCAGDSILLINTTTDGTSFNWATTNGTISDPSAQNAYLVPSASGNCQVTLTASNSAGNDQMVLNISVTVQDGPIASAMPDATDLVLPNAVVLFTNSSQNADTYTWYFGDGESSTDVNPWHPYSAAGTYTVMLVASRAGCLNDTTYFTINVGNAGVFSNQLEQVTVFPNPFNDQFLLTGKGISEVFIYDVQGKLIQQEKIAGKDTIPVDLSNAANGTYLLKVRLPDGTVNLRLVKN